MRIFSAAALLVFSYGCGKPAPASDSGSAPDAAVDPCTRCGSLERCVRGQCYATRCGGECPSGQICLDGACSDEACAGVSCGPGVQCTQGTCTGCKPGYHATDGGCAVTRALGQSCATDDDCGSGLCIDFVCCGAKCLPCQRCQAPSGSCTTAVAGSAGEPPCAPYVCTGFSPACPFSCSKPTDCAPSYACVNGTCARDGG